jgi:pimeloyl-ACP methyl ester carboxylesterase
MQPEVLYALTDDSWQLAIHYWEGKDKRRYPILMVHGLGTNRLNIDLDERYSVARAARDRGFSVYILELRGAGLSRPPDGKDRTLFEWGFGEHRDYDLPAAVRLVLEHSGATALHGFGHSMGGMLIYALGTRRIPQLRSISTVASPLMSQIELGTRERRLMQLGIKLAPANSLRRVPIKQLMGVAGRFISLSSRLADGMLLNAANCEQAVMAKMAREGITDIPRKLLIEMWAQMTGDSQNGPFDHEGKLEQIDVPVQALSGSVDRIAPSSAVEAAVARLYGPDVRYRKMGVESGDRADYGHGDLLVGRSAPEEVYPLLLDFIEEMD